MCPRRASQACHDSDGIIPRLALPAVENPTQANVKSSLEISSKAEKSSFEALVAEKREKLIRQASDEVLKSNLASRSTEIRRIDASLVAEIREELIRKASSEAMASPFTSNGLVNPHKYCL